MPHINSFECQAYAMATKCDLFICVFLDSHLLFNFYFKGAANALNRFHVMMITRPITQGSRQQNSKLGIVKSTNGIDFNGRSVKINKREKNWRHL